MPMPRFSSPRLPVRRPPPSAAGLTDEAHAPHQSNPFDGSELTDLYAALLIIVPLGLTFRLFLS